jgi:hypothetical protein
MKRSAFLMLDFTVALTVLLAVMLIASQTALWSLTERNRGQTRQEAIEAVANVMESARAASFDELDASWAAARKLPESLANRLDRATLVVRIEEEKGRGPCKRVSVEMTWNQLDGKPAAPVSLTAVFSPRSAEAKGGKP